MQFMRKILALIAFAAAGTAALPALSADYPVKSIEMVVGANPGGGTDVMARLYAEAAKKYVSQPLVVSNKPGASGGIAFAEVQRAAPDGYKMAVLMSELAILPHLGISKVTTTDFIPIARLNADPGLVAVRADSPFQTIEEFLAQARKQPGSLSVGNSGAGSIWHLASAAIEDKAGVKFNHVPFPGAAPGVLALLGGHIDAALVSPAEIGPYVTSGKIRVLVVLADRRLAAPYDKVATFKEKGLDISIGTWRGLGVPLGTSPEVVKYLRDAARKTAEEPSFRDAMGKANLQLAYMDAEAFQAYMNSQSDYFKVLLARLNLNK